MGASRSFEREPRLAASARAGEDEEPHLPSVQKGGKGLQVVVTADQPVGRHGQRAGPLDEREVEIGVLLEDAPLYIAKLRAGLEPELLVESAAKGRVQLECLRLAPAPVQRDHRLLLELFAQRILRGKAANLAEHLCVAPERELCVDALLEGDEAQLLQALDLRLEKPRIPHVPVCTAAPESRRLLGERQGKRVVRVAPRRSAFLHQALEANRIHQRRRDFEHVRPSRRHDPGPRREGPPQLRDIDLHELAGRRRRVGLPERLDELVHGTRLAVGHEQRCQEPAVLRRERDRAVVSDDLHWTEHPNRLRRHRGQSPTGPAEPPLYQE